MHFLHRQRGGWLAGLWCLGAVLSCRCGDPSLDPLSAGFRVDSPPLSFGRVVTGEQAVRRVRLVSTGRATLEVALETEAPFAVTPPVVSLAPGGEAWVDVVFTAPVGVVDGSLRMRADDVQAQLALSGVGVVGLSCAASSPCQTASFDLEREVCTELPKPEGAGCEPSSACLDRGRCERGECRGETRSCDDENRCTADACSETEGCVHAPVACPPPGEACRVATCDPETGCGTAWAVDGTPCGPVDCVTARLCVAGQCVSLPTPDGTVCAPKTLCQPEGTCQAQQCERPVPEEWKPAFSAPVDSASAPTLVGGLGERFVSGCRPAGDGGCRLRSFTANGFERFTSALADDAPRLLSVNAGGVWSLGADGGALRAWSVDAGARLGEWPLAALSVPPDLAPALAEVERATVAWSAAGAPVCAVRWRPSDGGVAFADVTTLAVGGADGGWSTLEQRGLGPPTALALDALGSAVVLDAAGRVTRLDLDGGSLTLGTAPAAAGLVTAGGRWFTGSALGGTEASGATALPASDAGALVPGALLLSSERAYAFRSGADGGLWLRAFDTAAGALAWEAPVVEGGLAARVESAARVASQPEGIFALTESATDGGPQVQAHLLAEGASLLTCPLQQPAQVGGAAYDDGWLYLLVNRSGQWRLEGFDLQGLTFAPSGWPELHGRGGDRRERP